jgi:signal peptidase I
VDFSAALTLLVAIAGLIWLIGKTFRRARRQRAAEGTIVEPQIVQYARSLFPVILFVLIIRSFVIEPFRIPSESMMPGLVDGDFIFVSKFAYGLRLPVINSRVLSTGHPQRGDVIVFRLPRDPSVNYIKRLVGLPGDHVAVRNNQVFVNGSPLAQIPDGTYTGSRFAGSDLKLEQIDKREHLIMLAMSLPITDYEATIPAGQYFFMGDNRNDSEDSRFLRVGFVPEANLVGRADRIWLNWDFPRWPNLRRIGMKIT